MQVSIPARRSRMARAGLALFTLAVLPSPASADEPASRGIVEVAGRVQCIGARRCALAPVPLHPVIDVRVQPGSRVKKGELLVKLEDCEQEAEVHAKQAALESAQLALNEARRQLAALDRAPQAVPEKQYYDARLLAQKAERDERAARAALEAAQAELEHYEVRAQIDGVVSWLDVHVGMVSRPGTTVWGEILDLREVDVICDLTLEQAAEIRKGQAAEVRRKGKYERFGTGQVVYVGIEAHPKTELVPVYIRLSNPKESLRSGEPVLVRFAGDSAMTTKEVTSEARRR